MQNLAAKKVKALTSIMYSESTAIVLWVNGYLLHHVDYENDRSEHHR